MLRGPRVYRPSVRPSAPTRQQSTLRTGFRQNHAFPNVEIVDGRNNLKSLHAVLEDKKSVVVFQPGVTQPFENAYHQSQWSAINGAQKCEEQLEGYANHYASLKEQGYNLAVVLSHRSAKYLAAIECVKSLPFSLYALTEASTTHLSVLGFPLFQFNNTSYPIRSTFVLDNNKDVRAFYERQYGEPKDEAALTLHELFSKLNVSDQLSRPKV